MEWVIFFLFISSILASEDKSVKCRKDKGCSGEIVWSFDLKYGSDGCAVRSIGGINDGSFQWDCKFAGDVTWTQFSDTGCKDSPRIISSKGDKSCYTVNLGGIYGDIYCKFKGCSNDLALVLGISIPVTVCCLLLSGLCLIGIGVLIGVLVFGGGGTVIGVGLAKNSGGNEQSKGEKVGLFSDALK